MQTYLWTEDQEGKSGYQFWKTMTEQLFPCVIVESKKNNSELIKAVRHISDQENRYIIAYDHSFDNDQIIREMKKLDDYVREKKNVYVIDMICFEYLLLEFDQLDRWVLGGEMRQCSKRMELFRAREKLLAAVDQETDYKEIPELVHLVRDIDEYNIEQISARLLYRLTRNTGFEVSKGGLGECWQTDCCGYLSRKEDDICGLDGTGTSLAEKMRMIYKGTRIEREFNRCGLGGGIC